MQKPKKQKINKVVILSVIIAVITSVIGMVFIYIPFANKTKALRYQILRERDRNILIGKIRALGKHLKVYQKRVPEEGRGVSWLLSQVSDMASKEQIDISSIKPGVPEDRGLYVQLYVVADTVSTYHQLGKFIARIESSEKFMRVESIDVKKLDEDKGYDINSSKYKPFDVEAHIVISTVIFKR